LRRATTSASAEISEAKILRLRQFFGERDGNAAGAGTDVGDEKSNHRFVGAAGAKFAESEAVECDFDKVLVSGRGIRTSV